MVVCLCKGVNDRKIRALVEGGAQTLREVVRSCQAGSDCGACLCQVKELIDQARQEQGQSLGCASGDSKTPQR